jgi:hypothetical protein
MSMLSAFGDYFLNIKIVSETKKKFIARQGGRL